MRRLGDHELSVVALYLPPLAKFESKHACVVHAYMVHQSLDFHEKVSPFPSKK